MFPVLRKQQHYKKNITRSVSFIIRKLRGGGPPFLSSGGRESGRRGRDTFQVLHVTMASRSADENLDFESDTINFQDILELLKRPEHDYSWSTVSIHM